MTLVSILVSIGLAVGPALVYSEQAYRMQERRNSEGFSKDVCAVLLIANIARVYWWFPVRYELTLLVQSLLMIVAQLGLLYLCLLYRPGSFASSAFSVSSSDSQRRDVLFDAEPPGSGVSREARHPTFQMRVDPPPEDQDSNEQGHHAPSHSASGGFPPSVPRQHARSNSSSSSNGGVPSLSVSSLELPASIDSNRPFGFWTWPDFTTYVYALLIITAALGVLQLLLGWSSFYVSLLGFFALGLESMLPIPQLIKNHQRQSLAGFQLTVLAGWTFGDAFKSAYYIVNSTPIQFTLFGIFQLCVDLLICAQAYAYRDKTARDNADMLAQQRQAAELRRAERGEGEDVELPPKAKAVNKAASSSQKVLAGSSSKSHTAEDAHGTSPATEPFSVGDIEADEDEDVPLKRSGR